MTNEQSKVMKQMPRDAWTNYSHGRGVDYKKGNLAINDAHAWLVDDAGIIYDTSPLLPEWKIFEPTLHYHKAPNSEKLCEEARERNISRQQFFKQVGWYKDYYNSPEQRECYANAIEYQKHHPHLHLVIGSQGFCAKGGNTIFWEFG